MLRAAIGSVALHLTLGALVLALRPARETPKPPAVAVEVEMISRPPVARERLTTAEPEAARLESAMRRVVTPPTRVKSAVRTKTPEDTNANANANANANTNTNANAPPTVNPPALETKPNLFAASVLSYAAGVDLEAPAPSSFRPRHGVGAVDGRGGVAVGDFLAEDAGRERAQKGAVPPFVREVERQLGETFSPPFGHVDNGNRKELLHKQMMGFLRTPPRTGELARGVDPERETTEQKLNSTADHAFFLGRRALVFARQRADGTIAELSLRQSSGFHAFDDDALDAVYKALSKRSPRAGETGEVRTLWQLDATGYVVIAPEPTLKFDEATGKSEWIYPLQKRIDKAVKLLAIY